jgi:uncharacterized protein YcnI
MLRQPVGALVLGALAFGACLTVGPAIAHVTLENREAPVGAGYKAVLRVPHGCEGTATTTLRVRIPEGRGPREADAETWLGAHHRHRQVCQDL